MVRKFDNAIVTFYTLTPQRVEGTIVQGKTVLYTEIKAGFWRASRSYWSTTLAVQTNQNSYTLCIEWKYTGVQVWDIATIDNVDYKVEEIIDHPDSKGRTDNFELIVSKSTND